MIKEDILELINKKFVCPFCRLKFHRNVISRHLKTVHKLYQRIIFYLAKIILKQKFCECCKKIIDINKVISFSFSSIKYFSSNEKIVCSNSCSKSMSNIIRHQENPEYTKRFSDAGIRYTRRRESKKNTSKIF